MYLLRRAALRSLQARPLSAQHTTTRSFVSSHTSITRSTSSSFQSSWIQRRQYSDDKTNESPAEKEAEGAETVTSEPSAEEQKNVREESIATSETTSNDSVSSSTDATTQESESASVHNAAADAISSAAAAATSAASNAVRNVASAGRSNPNVDRGFEGVAQGSPSKILYVGNLYFDLTPDRLKEEFEQFGTVINVKIVTDSNGLSKGFGYIEYDDIDSAHTAIEQLNQTELEGRRMTVQFHIRRERKMPYKASNPASRTLFIGNISFQTSDKDLNDLFRSLKNVTDVRVAVDRRSGQPRGFAHADFTDIASAEKAKKVLETKNLYGRTLRIDFGLPSSLGRNSESLE